MATDDFNSFDTSNPIDTAEIVATSKGWGADRLDYNQIMLTIEGQWRTYSVTMVLDHENNLRLIGTFEVEPPNDKLPILYETINLINDNLWGASFSYWKKTKLMTIKKMHFMNEGDVLSDDFIAKFIETTASTGELYYPVFTQAVWGEKNPKDAMNIAFASPSGKTARPS